MALARAEHAGARQLVPEDFAKADAVLREGESLIRSGRYELARQILPQAEALAREAVTLAQVEYENRERLRQEAEAAAAALAESSQPPQPPKITKPSPEPTPPLTAYPVRENESLLAIAARKDVYGDPLLWPILYQANRDQIKDPRQVYPGQVLSIPRGLTARDLEEAREKARRSDIFTVPTPARPYSQPPS